MAHPITAEMTKKLTQKIAELAEIVRTYESDTFSVEDEEITDDEAQQITLALIINAVDGLIELDHLDGIMLSDELENIRD